METSTRAGRWLVSGALGLAMLGAGGCATSAAPSSEDAGPAVVLNAPADAGPARPPSAKDTRTKGAGVTGAAGDSSADRASKRVDQGDASAKVPAAKPKSVNDSPNSPASPNTPASPRTAPSATTP
ncbi:MAG: hypothetical protein QM582_09320 [Micropruina sp.]|uniref:hypothetical protein n=1 Tax=Micropruina sp. TaxID=2737536 RepID=UPI0039E343AD